MIFRAFRVKTTGQWCEPMIQNGKFADNGFALANRVAKTLGLPPNSLEVVDSETDPRTGDLISEPNDGPPPAPQPDIRAFNTAVVDNAGTFGLVKYNTLLKAWPTLSVFIAQSNWDVVTEIVAEAVAGPALTAQEGIDLLAIMVANGFPVT